jgi:hypothetical protein
LHLYPRTPVDRPGVSTNLKDSENFHKSVCPLNFVLALCKVGSLDSN